MKKVLIITILFITKSISLNAGEITNSYWTNSGSDRYKVTTFKCDNGSNIFINYYPDNTSAKYFVGNGIYYSFDEAIRKSCSSKKNQSKKYKKIRKGCFYCEKRSAIQQALKSSYTSAIASIEGKDFNKNCGQAAKNYTVIVIKSYNGKNKGLVEDYVKVKAGNEYYYVKKRDLH